MRQQLVHRQCASASTRVLPLSTDSIAFTAAAGKHRQVRHGLLADRGIRAAERAAQQRRLVLASLSEATVCRLRTLTT
jgi:hypothetical protein